MKARGRRPSAFIVFEFKTLMKHEARVFEITSPTYKINLNNVSQFNYYIWDVKCA